MSISIDDLLNSLNTPSNPNSSSSAKTLPNNKDTWSRIGKKDSFEELGLSSSDLENFLDEWCVDNPYNNI
jgi:hypothetical protein